MYAHLIKKNKGDRYESVKCLYSNSIKTTNSFVGHTINDTLSSKESEREYNVVYSDRVL